MELQVFSERYGYPSGPPENAPSQSAPSSERSHVADHLLRRSLHALRAQADEAQILPTPPFGPGRVASGIEEPRAQAINSALAELRAATTLTVRSLRLRGVPPEKALSHIKSAVRAALPVSGWNRPDAIHTLIALVVSWSIDAYYVR